LVNNQQQFINRDAAIIAIAGQNVTEAISTSLMVNRPNSIISLLADVDNVVAKSYHVFGMPYNPDEGEPNTLSNFPSVFIIGPDRNIIWEYLGKTDHDRPTTIDVISNLP
jgi:peroxiredoxin